MFCVKKSFQLTALTKKFILWKERKEILEVTHKWKKKPILTLEQVKEIEKTYPTPFHIYDEKGIRENARALKKAFSWNKGYREYFAVKATPNPFILKILQEEGCGVDCSSLTELMLSEALGFTKSDIMFSSNVTPLVDIKKPATWALTSIWMTTPTLII